MRNCIYVDFFLQHKGKIDTGSPCPICRDEYLVLDYRNTGLLKQFISPYTGEIIKWNVTNLCQRAHYRMVLEMNKAKYFGTMSFKVPFRQYDYQDYQISPPSSPKATTDQSSTDTTANETKKSP